MERLLRFGRWLALGLVGLPVLALNAQSSLPVALKTGEGATGFRVFGPAAARVVVRGDWLKAPVNLKREVSGWWTPSFDPPEAGIHRYEYVAESGALPPEEIGWRVLHVPRAAEPEFNFDAPRGTVRILNYDSAVLGMKREAWIYLPPKYDQTAGSFPLLVLQHAGADTEKTWVAKGNVDWLLDQLIAGKKARPMVVLMLAGHPQGESVYTKPGTRVKAMQDLEHELLAEAVPALQASYRIAAERERWALAGPSIGGGQAESIGLKHLERFAWIGSFSGGHALPEFYAAALTDAAATNARLKLWWIGCGTEDGQFPANLVLVQELDQRGIHHEWHPTPGGHSWVLWRQALGDYLTRIFP